jgi:hypothetical protein
MGHDLRGTRAKQMTNARNPNEIPHKYAFQQNELLTNPPSCKPRFLTNVGFYKGPQKQGFAWNLIGIPHKSLGFGMIHPCSIKSNSSHSAPNHAFCVESHWDSSQICVLTEP